MSFYRKSSSSMKSRCRSQPSTKYRYFSHFAHEWYILDLTLLNCFEMFVPISLFGGCTLILIRTVYILWGHPSLFGCRIYHLWNIVCFGWPWKCVSWVPPKVMPYGIGSPYLQLPLLRLCWVTVITEMYSCRVTPVCASPTVPFFKHPNLLWPPAWLNCTPYFIQVTFLTQNSSTIHLSGVTLN